MWESGADDDDVLCDVTVVLLQLSERSDRALCSYFFFLWPFLYLFTFLPESRNSKF